MHGNEQLSISLVHCAVTVRLLTVQTWTYSRSVQESFHSHKHRSHSCAEDIPEHMQVTPNMLSLCKGHNTDYLFILSFGKV